MARTRFTNDAGLTVRMTTVMFCLGALFVAFVVALMYVAGQAGYGGLIPFIALVAMGVAWWQWWSSDRLAMRAMRAHEVSPQQDPELHGIIDRLCALADMPKPRVAVSDAPIPNAFATGRSPKRSVVCVTRQLRRMLTPQELEAVLSHELSHVAHRDVLVMTMASSAGILAGMLARGAQYGFYFGGGGGGRRGGNNNNGGGMPVAVAMLIGLAVSLLVYAVSWLLTRLLSRYRELCADRSGAYLTQQPSALASALQKISGTIAQQPQRDLREVSKMNAFFITPAVHGLSWSAVTSTHPSLEQRLEQLSRIATELGRPMDGGPATSSGSDVGPLPGSPDRQQLPPSQQRRQPFDQTWQHSGGARRERRGRGGR